MKFSYQWLNEYFDGGLPPVGELARVITMQSFEIESVEPHGNDSILDIKVLPNRAHDCFSYHGMAREIGALINIKPTIPESHPKKDVAVSSAEHVTLTVEDSRLVPRATKRYVEGVVVGESPQWLKDKLAAHGQRSINNIVDATNLVMFETGQPVHAFDWDKIKDGRTEGRKDVSIRSAREGETITTLDNKEFALEPGMLVISDNEKALDIAGVKGGAVSGVDAGTTRLLLSACTFDPVSIRKTSQKLKLRTDASARFEQGIAPELAGLAMERLAELVADLANGRVAADIVDVYPIKKNLYKVGVSLSEISARIGVSVSKSDVESIFNRLGFEYDYVKPLERVLEIAPTLIGAPYKLGASVLADAPATFDCSSLVAYIFGVYGGVMLPRMSVDQYVFGVPVEASEAKPGNLVFANTGVEPIHFESKEFMRGTPVSEGVDHVGIYLGDGTVLHASRYNTNGTEIQRLAESDSFKNIVGYRRMITSDEERFVVTVPAPRLDIRIKEDLIEEIGRLMGLENIASVSLPSIDAKPAVNKDEYYKALIRRELVDVGAWEVYTYSFQPGGDVAVENPLSIDKKFLRASLEKGLREALDINYKNRALLGFKGGKPILIFEIGTVFEKDREYLQLGIATNDSRSMKQACDVVKELTNLSADVSKDSQIALFDLTGIEDLNAPDSYGDLPRLPEITFKPISSYPFVLRDIAVWVAEEGRKDERTEGNEELEGVIKKHADNLLARLDLFDTFSKDGRTSYAYHIVFQSYEKTLSDDDVNSIMKQIEDDICAKGWEVR